MKKRNMKRQVIRILEDFNTEDKEILINPDKNMANDENVSKKIIRG
jgi:hypothetical protein